MLFDGGEFGTQAAVGSDEEADYLGLPGLLEPDQVATLLQARQSAHRETRSRRSAASAATAAAHRAVPALRKELNGLVAAWHHRTGIPHGAVHTELRQACGGPLAAQATRRAAAGADRPDQGVGAASPLTGGVAEPAPACGGGTSASVS